MKYVALLAFNRIVVSHPVLVSMQQDVIFECLEDADISIRLQALDLASGMVTSDTLQPVVNRLVKQLNNAYLVPPEDSTENQGFPHEAIKASKSQRAGDRSLFLPPEYKLEVLHRIVDICSGDNYLQLPDFEWYIGALEQLVKHLPAEDIFGYQHSATNPATDIACRVGSEIRNVAVRVRNVRTEATRAAESLILSHDKSVFLPRTANGSILSSLVWVVGEYAEHLLYPGQTLQSLIDASNVLLPPTTLSIYLQAIPKILVHLISNGQSWDKFQKSETSLLLARVIEFLETLASHAGLDVQERASEFLEALRLATEAIHSGDSSSYEVPFILSTVIPGLFTGLELNPVAVSAQKKVPLPEKLDLDRPLNGNSLRLFYDTNDFSYGLDVQDLSQDFYYTRDTSTPYRNLTDVTHANTTQLDTSYQNLAGGSIDTGSKTRRMIERRDRNKEDPFYVDVEETSSGTSTPFHKVFNASNGDGVDVDSIPIIDLKILNDEAHDAAFPEGHKERKGSSSRPKKYDVAVDETIGHEGAMSVNGSETGETGEAKRSLLQVDSSGLGHLSLEEDTPGSGSLHSHGQGDNGAEMAKAMEEVERLRLEMQRASERIHAKDVPTEGMLVKKKKKKNRKSHLKSLDGRGEDPTIGKKKRG